MSLVTNPTLIRLKNRLSSHCYTCIRNVTSPSNKENTINIVDDNLVNDNEAEIEKICNKSRLKSQHRNLLFGEKPYAEPLIDCHYTVKYNRKLYGKYGSASGVNPGIMWPTKEDLKERKEFESVAYPHTISEMVNAAKKEIEEKENEKLEKEKQVIANMAKLQMWKKQLKDTIAKKEAEAIAAKEKKARLMEEVRRHFGFTVDPRDEKFKEMLTKKEKEMKKKEKQARIQEREKKAIAKLMESHISNTEKEQ